MLPTVRARKAVLRCAGPFPLSETDGEATAGGVIDQGLDIAPQHARGAGAYSNGNVHDLLRGSNDLWVRSAVRATQAGARSPPNQKHLQGLGRGEKRLRPTAGCPA